MGVGKLGKCQFRFGADGIQARRIEDDQALFEQGVREIDDCMAPTGDFHQPIGVRFEAILAFRIDGKAELDRKLLRDILLFADAGQGGMHGFRGCRLKHDMTPLFRKPLEFGHAGISRTGFDRQQLDRGGLPCIEEQFGRTHGGATGA